MKADAALHVPIVIHTNISTRCDVTLLPRLFAMKAFEMCNGIWTKFAAARTTRNQFIVFHSAKGEIALAARIREEGAQGFAAAGLSTSE
jgi:hypothetical protein